MEAIKESVTVRKCVTTADALPDLLMHWRL